MPTRLGPRICLVNMLHMICFYILFGIQNRKYLKRIKKKNL